MPLAEPAGANGSSPAAAAAEISARIGVVEGDEMSDALAVPSMVGADAVSGTPSDEAVAGSAPDGTPVAGVAPTSTGGAPVVRATGGDA